MNAVNLHKNFDVVQTLTICDQNYVSTYLDVESIRITSVFNDFNIHLVAFL